MANEGNDGVALLVAAAREFIRKVESGEAKSVRSYEQFKEALKQFDDDVYHGRYVR